MSDSLTPAQVFDQMMTQDHFSKWLGVELLDIGTGYCKLSMKVRKEMLNGFGILHGGVSFAFADSAFAFASNSHGRLSVSQNSQITHMKACHLGETLIAEAEELHIGHKMATYDVRIYRQENMDLIALFRGSVYRTSKSLHNEDRKHPSI